MTIARNTRDSGYNSGFDYVVYKNTGTVSYDIDYVRGINSDELSKQTVAQNSAIQEPEVPVKEGFDFAGRYTDKELKEKYDFSARVTKNSTLYAAWTEKR